jgi:uncharacterized SAM-binding protein YcdF (DUF218 family)
LLLLLVLVLFVAATARLFVWPPSNLPQRADAAVALGGDPGQLRAKEAIRLVREGFAPVAVISLGGTTPAPCPHPEPKVAVICFRADPLDTRGEAQYVGALAARRQWNRLIVVPQRSQATRARMLFERCTRARLIVVPIADPLSSLFVAIPYEWGALVKALIVRGC